MHALVRQLKLRLIAGAILAVTGNSSAAAGAGDRAVEQFRAQTTEAAPPIVIMRRVNPAPSAPSPMAPAAPVAPAMAAPAAPSIPAAAPVQIAPAPSTPPAIAAPAQPKPLQTTTQTPSGFPVMIRTTQDPNKPSIPVSEMNEEQMSGWSGFGCKDGTCYKEIDKNSMEAQMGSLANLRDALEKGTNRQAMKDRLSELAVQEALADRATAQFCQRKYGFPQRMSGNISKCSCAGGVKDSLMRAGLCNSRPGGDISAVMLAGIPEGKTSFAASQTPNPKADLTSYCPAFRRTDNRQPDLEKSKKMAENAPPGSVIIYSTSRHEYGHIETVVQVTDNNIKSIQKSLGRVRIGQKLYCSDFCRPAPTFSHGTNRVEAIYSL